jgi:hypothetical protein
MRFGKRLQYASFHLDGCEEMEIFTVGLEEEKEERDRDREEKREEERSMWPSSPTPHFSREDYTAALQTAADEGLAGYITYFIVKVEEMGGGKREER